jgi:hypothetical protein
MAIEWPAMEERGPVVTEADVAALEQRLGKSLPDDYRRFLLEVNGGRPADEACEFSKGAVVGLLSLKPAEEVRDLEVCTARAAADLNTRDVVVVGYDEGGSRILVAIDGEHRGQVWFHIPNDERPPDANPRVLWHDRRDVSKLADSFEAFMSSLTPYQL